MLRIVTNKLVILASAASQLPYENNVPCNFQGVPGQASLLSLSSLYLLVKHDA